MDNANTKEYLDKIRRQVVENLKKTAFAPSVQMTDVPRDPLVGGMDDEADAILDDLDEDENKDKRITKRRFDQYIEKPGELSDSEDEEENAAHGIRRQPGAFKRRNQVNYRNLDVTDSGVDSGLATPRDASSIAGDDMDTTMADTKMADEPEPAIVENHVSPPAAELTPAPAAAPAAEPVAEPAQAAAEAPAPEPTPAVVNGQEKVPSAPPSRQPSPTTRDEDIPMEDVGAPAPEPERESKPEPEQAQAQPPTSGAQEEKKPKELPVPDRAPTELASPATKEPSPAKEVPESAETAEKPTEGPKGEEAPVNVEQQPPKESTTEQAEEPAKKSEG